VAEKLVVQGAREHNLKGIDLELPRDKLIVFTGLSGSGKSSLAFDTIYAEGQRRYVESLSSYARQFLGQMDKPDVDFIEGLSPAISIDQKSAGRNPRSTVGTITEVYDYLRLLFARIGVPHCPNDGTPVARQTPQQIVDRIMELEEGTRFQVLAPVVHGRKGTYDTLLADLAKQGFARAIVDGELMELGPEMHLELERYEMHTIQVVVDRLVAKPDMARRLTDSLETALALAEGVVEIQIVPRDRELEPDDTITFSQHFGCPTCGMSFQDLAPRNFSFNSPYGACSACDGLGTRFEVDPELVVPDPDLPVDEGAIAPWAGGNSTYFHRLVEAVMEGADQEAAAEPALRQGRLQGHGHLQEPLRPHPHLQRQLRGRGSVPVPPPLRGRLRLPARADRGVHARGALPHLRGQAPQPHLARRLDRRAQHRRHRRPGHR
jgi:excinuclease ABC subunit A